MPKPKKRSKNDFLLLKITLFVSVFVVGFIGYYYQAQYKKEHTCANSESCIKDLSGEYNSSEKIGVFLGHQFTPPQFIVSEVVPPKVLGKSNAEKKIFVDLSTQKLYAVEDNIVKYSFPVSTGKWGRTPTGTFKIWVKLRYTRMSGGNPALGTYYNLPNVPYTMFYYNDETPKIRGFSVHGAYWHDNFGHPMSHGCVNMRIADAGELYAWADPVIEGNTTYADEDNPGTEVIVYGTTPNE